MHKDNIEKGISKIIQEAKKVKKSNNDISMFIKENVRALYKNKNFTHSQLLKRKYDLNMLMNPTSNILMSVAIGVCGSLIAAMLYSLYTDPGVVKIISNVFNSFPANLELVYETGNFKTIMMFIFISLIIILLIAAVPIIIALAYMAFIYIKTSPNIIKLEVYSVEIELIDDILKLNNPSEDTDKEDAISLNIKNNENKQVNKIIIFASILIPIFASGAIVYFQRKNDR